MNALAKIGKWAIALALNLSAVANAQSVQTSSSSPALKASIRLTPILVDYELPGHPNTRGRGHAGVIGRATLVFTHDPILTIEAGALGRLPFAHDIREELGALPVLSLTLRPFGEGLILRFGSLDDHHGFHPALVDEARYRYGRNYEENYNRSLLAEARRDLGGDPFLPAEHGAQLIARADYAYAEVFLDWQLLETAEHREKFAFGILGGISHPLGDLDLQLRLVHYGGELFTKGDPIRFAQLDPVRQPIAFAIAGKARPLAMKNLVIELPISWVRGRLAQTAGGAPESQHGFELGAEALFFDVVRLGYRLWLPLERDAGFISEDGDPVYAGRRSQRARLIVATRHGIAELSGRLDLVFARGTEKVQYETVTILTCAFDPLLWSSGR